MSYNPDNRAQRQRTSSPANTRFKPQANAVRQPGGNWQSRYEHYRNLAQQTGDIDRVTRENYWQHAEHFMRLMNGSAAQQA
ncbi:MAG: DUF4167 domain-containing protein [Rhizomicrobium sp.]